MFIILAVVLTRWFIFFCDCVNYFRIVHSIENIYFDDSYTCTSNNLDNTGYTSRSVIKTSLVSALYSLVEVGTSHDAVLPQVGTPAHEARRAKGRDRHTRPMCFFKHMCSLCFIQYSNG